MNNVRSLVTVGIAGYLLGVPMSPSLGAAVLTNTAAVKTAIGDDLTDVRWGWGWGACAFVGGLALGAALATPYYAYGYPYYGYRYGYSYYGYPHGYSYYGYPRRYYGWYPHRRAYWGWYGRYW